MRLPSIHPRKLDQLLAKVEWYEVKTTGGYHIKYKEGHPNPVGVPYHGGRDVKRGTLRKILRDTGISRDEFFDLLGRRR
jgi:predicted RNA binding protein YcfA (HicA-like mRNA interferase family)